jgi:hypothetical protein
MIRITWKVIVSLELLGHRQRGSLNWFGYLYNRGSGRGSYGRMRGRGKERALLCPFAYRVNVIVEE